MNGENTEQSSKGAPLRVLGISGSLRQKSYNTIVLRTAQELAPAGVAIEIFDLAPIPLYNEDVREKGYPDSVKLFREKIREADALLISTPEYNYSIPGVLKNAIDWASRPPDQPFEGKPIALMGASPSALGSARSQYHLRQCFIFLNGLLLNRPEVFIGRVNEKVDDSGRLFDEKTREIIGRLLVSLQQWVDRVSPRKHGQTRE